MLDLNYILINPMRNLMEQKKNEFSINLIFSMEEISIHRGRVGFGIDGTFIGSVLFTAKMPFLYLHEKIEFFIFFVFYYGNRHQSKSFYFCN